MQLNAFQLWARGRLQANRAVSKLNVLLVVTEKCQLPTQLSGALPKASALEEGAPVPLPPRCIQPEKRRPQAVSPVRPRNQALCWARDLEMRPTSAPAPGPLGLNCKLGCK